MNIEVLMKCIGDIVQEYFKDTVVKWSWQNDTKNPLPFVTLQLGTITYATYPISSIDSENGERSDYISYKTALDVNIYSKNYAVFEEMRKFKEFLDSEYVLNYCSVRDIAMLPQGGIIIQPTTVNNVVTEHRAFQEFALYFTTETIGTTAADKTGSAISETGWFNRVEIESE